MEAISGFRRPMPALTPAQRYSLDVHGYVIVPDVLTQNEVETLKNALQNLKEELFAAEGAPETIVRGARFRISQPHHFFLGSILQSDPAFAAYATHPRLVGMAEELIGGEARIVEVNGRINRRNPDEDFSAEPKYKFHRGTDIPFSSHSVGGLNHCAFVKTLTALTDIYPDDGGTVVIAGSHKIDCPRDDLMNIVAEDPSLIHQMEAKAGSTLLFSETLIHATGQIRSDRERMIVISGYGSRLFPWWDGSEFSQEFLESVPEPLHTLINGKTHWTRAPKYRELCDKVDENHYDPVPWPNWPEIR